MTKNIARRAAVTTLLAAGIVAGFGGAAQAAPDAASTAELRATTVLPPGDQQLYSTWFWGSTRLCVTNLGTSPGELTVQSTSPAAGPEILPLGGRASQCIDRWWWGVPVWAINSGSTTLTVSTS